MFDPRILGIAAAMLATPALSAPPLAPLTDETFHEIAEQVFRPVTEEFSIPGLALGVTLDGRQYVFTDGLADRATGRAVDADTLFELGSNSKLFNVALAALAERKGLLSLGDPVSVRKPALAGSAFDAITLSDLAAHATGSLPLQFPEHIHSDAELTTYLRDWTPGIDPAASRRSYSNVSIALLGQIAGEAFGTGYETALRQNLLAPLGLDNTFTAVPEAAQGRYAFGYSRNDDRPIRVNPGFLDAEAYGIRSSVTDMLRFLDAHLDERAVAPDLAAALARTRVAAFDTAYFAQAMIWEGYPWPVDPAQLAAGNGPDMAMKPQPMTPRAPVMLDGSVLLAKTGATNGFGSYVAMIPSRRIGVVMLANRNIPNPVRAEAARELITRILAQAEM